MNKVPRHEAQGRASGIPAQEGNPKIGTPAGGKTAAPGPEHYEMSTPPSASQYPVLSATPISRQTERSIAQRNRDIAKSNAKSLFGEGLPASQRNPAVEKKNMKHLFGEEVEIVPSAPGLEPKHELKSQKGKE